MNVLIYYNLEKNYRLQIYPKYFSFMLEIKYAFLMIPLAVMPSFTRM